MNKLDMSKELKPCPFCKTTDLYMYPDGDMEGHAVMGDHEDWCPLGTFGYEEEADAIEKWNTRAQLNSGEWVSVPKGWKLVPVQPTPQMLNAGVNAGVCASPEPWCPAAYQAMINTAPQPPEEK